MPFYIIGFIILLVALFNYKSAIIVYLAFKLFLVQNITLISIPGIPLLTLDMFMEIIFVLLYMFKKKSLRKARYSYPFITPSILLFVCWFVSSLFSAAGVVTEMSALVGSFLDEILIIAIAWEVIETKQDFDQVFSLITVVIFISCIYGFLEYSLQANPLSIYEATLNKDPSRTINWSYGVLGARGYHVNSIFEHAIGASITWALYVAFVFTSIITYEEKLKLRVLSIITSVLCIPLIILTKQRSGLVLLLFLLLLFFKPRKKKTLILFVFILFAFGIFYDKIVDNIALFFSLFSSKYQNVVSGSSIDMRIEQFLAAFRIMLRSPVWGFGSKYRSIISNSDTAFIRGAESIWFTVIPAYGLIGIIAYLFQIWWGAYTLPKFFKSKDLRWLMISFWFVASLTSLPGFNIHILYLFAFYLIKKSSIYKATPYRINEWQIKNHDIRHKNVFNSNGHRRTHVLGEVTGGYGRK